MLMLDADSDSYAYDDVDVDADGIFFKRRRFEDIKYDIWQKVPENAFFSPFTIKWNSFWLLRNHIQWKNPKIHKFWINWLRRGLEPTRLRPFHMCFRILWISHRLTSYDQNCLIGSHLNNFQGRYRKWQNTVFFASCFWKVNCYTITLSEFLIDFPSLIYRG